MVNRIVYLEPHVAAVQAQLQALVPDGFEMVFATGREEDEHAALMRDADYAIVSSNKVTARMIDGAERMTLIHRWGIGIDLIDVEACRRNGIGLAVTHGVNAAPVAEMAVALTLDVLRQVSLADRAMREGRWLKNELRVTASSLMRKTVGVVGMGNIGRAYVRLLRGFDCTVLYTKRNRLPEAEEKALGLTYATFGEILERADVVSLHCPLTDETRGLVDAAVLRRMKPRAVLINVARGEIVVEEDLVAALREGVIAGAGIDV
ncbi:MAG: NAD(P)-dependent oxidoreductase [Acetobacterales bacterium]